MQVDSKDVFKYSQYKIGLILKFGYKHKENYRLTSIDPYKPRLNTKPLVFIVNNPWIFHYYLLTPI